MNILIEEQSKINKKCKMFKYKKHKFKIKIYKNTYLLRDCIVSGIDKFDNSNAWSFLVNITYNEYLKNEIEG